MRLSLPGLLIAGFGLFFCAVVLSNIAVAVRGRRARLRAAAAYREWLDQALGAWTAANGWQFHAGEVAAPWRERLAAGNRDFTVHCLSHQPSSDVPVTVAVCSYHVLGTRSITDSSGGSHGGGTVRVPVWLTVVILHLPGTWPGLHVRRREPLVDDGLWLPARFGAVPSPEAVRPVLTGDAAFDAQVRAGSYAPDVARPLLTRPVMDAHLRRQLDTWSLCGNELALVDEGRFDPATIRPRVERARWLAAALSQAPAS